MEIKQILSSDLRCLDSPVKELVNMGMWFLYKIHNYQSKNVAYFLEAGSTYYFLSLDGGVIASTQDYPNGLECDNRILFDDIPFPESIDDFQPAWA